MHYKDYVEPYAPYDTVGKEEAQAAFSLLAWCGMPLEVSQSFELPAHPHQMMTPYRLAYYLKYWFRPENLPRFTFFDNVNPTIDQLLVFEPVDYWACCSHHMLPFFGKVYIGYIPKEKLIGLSMVPLLVKEFCARPWVQEHMTHELADLFWEKADPLALAVVTTGQHTCAFLDLGEPAGMTLSDLRGNFFDSHKARDEFLRLAKVE